MYLAFLILHQQMEFAQVWWNSDAIFNTYTITHYQAL